MRGGPLHSTHLVALVVTGLSAQGHDTSRSSHRRVPGPGCASHKSASLPASSFCSWWPGGNWQCQSSFPAEYDSSASLGMGDGRKQGKLCLRSAQDCWTQEWQKLCPHLVVTGSLRSSKQMGQLVSAWSADRGASTTIRPWMKDWTEVGVGGICFVFSGIWALWDLSTEKQMYPQIPVLPVQILFVN